MPTSANNNPPLEGNMGLLLLDFFRLYGRTLKSDDVAISCRNGGSYFKKRENQRFLQRGDRRCFLAIEDPQDPTNDLAKGSYNILRVQRAFDFAYRQLSSPINPDDSTLERIIRLDAVLLSRVPTSRRANNDKSFSYSSGVSNALPGQSRKAVETPSSSEEDEEYTRLFESYDIEAKQLEAAAVRKADKGGKAAGDRKHFWQKGEKKKRDKAKKERAERENAISKGTRAGKRLREREAEFGDNEGRPTSAGKRQRN